MDAEPGLIESPLATLLAAGTCTGTSSPIWVCGHGWSWRRRWCHTYIQSILTCHDRLIESTGGLELMPEEARRQYVGRSRYMVPSMLRCIIPQIMYQPWPELLVAYRSGDTDQEPFPIKLRDLANLPNHLRSIPAVKTQIHPHTQPFSIRLMKVQASNGFHLVSILPLPGDDCWTSLSNRTQL